MPNSAKNTCSAAVREFREALGLSQTEFAKRIEYTREVIGAYENGRYHSNEDRLLARIRKFIDRMWIDEALLDLRVRCAGVLPEIFHALGTTSPTSTAIPAPANNPPLPLLPNVVHPEIDLWGKPIAEATDFNVFVGDDSMSPAIEKGTIITVVPGRLPRVGGPCFIKMADRAPVVRFYLGQNTGSSLHLQALQPKTDYSVPTAKVEWCYPIQRIVKEFDMSQGHFGIKHAG